MRSNGHLVGLCSAFLLSSIACTDLDVGEASNGNMQVEAPLVEAEGTWFPIGPAPIDKVLVAGLSGDGASPTTGNATGRTNVIAVNPQNAADVWLGTANGGVWHSTNANSPDPNWTPVADNIPSVPSLAIGAIALDGCDSTRCSTVYIGTGENSVRRDTLYGHGIIKGVFSGIEFGSYSFSEFAGTGALFRYGSVNNILVEAGGILYVTLSTGVTATMVGAQRRAPPPAIGDFGVYKFDANASPQWQRLSVGGSGVLPTDLERHPTVAGTFVAGFDGLGIFTSMAGNDNAWCPLNPGAGTGPAGCPDPATTGLPAAGTFDHVEIAVLPTKSTMYAMFGTCPFNTTNKQATLNPCVPLIFRSTNAGQTWTQAAATPTSDTRNAYSRYTHVLKINPLDEKILFHGGLKLWVSTDQGETFSQFGTGQLHPDQHDLVIVPGAGDGGFVLLYAANDGGFFSSRDGGGTWRSGNKNLVATAFYGIGTDEVDEGSGRATYITGGMQDNGTSLFQGSRFWSHQLDGDGGDAIVESPTLWYGSSQNLDIVRILNGDLSCGSKSFTSAGGECSLRGGTPGPEAQSSSPITRLPFAFQAVFTQHPNTDIYLATDKIWHTPSVNMGDWDIISPIFDPSTNVVTDLEGTTNIITAIAVAPSDANRIYVGFYDGQVWATKQGVAPCSTSTNGVFDCWERIDDGALPSATVASLTVHPTEPSTVWAAFSGFDIANNEYVWKHTLDASSQDVWTAKSVGLGNAPAKVIRIDPRTADILWLGTDTGAYKSENAGEEWLVFGASSGLPTVPVYDIAFMPDRGEVFAATHGRGVWMLSEKPRVGTFEGWMDTGIWDIPIYGVGFVCSGFGDCNCTVEILQENGAVCASSNMDADAHPGRIHIPLGGDTLVTTNMSWYNGRPVAWGCRSGNCVGNTPIEDCNQPGNRISAVRVACDQNPVVVVPVAGECPQQAQPPSSVFQIEGITASSTPSSLAAAAVIGTRSFDVVPTVLASLANGGDRALCAARVFVQEGQTNDEVSEQIRDAINASPDCIEQGVTARQLSDSDSAGGEDEHAADTRIILSAAGVVGSQIILGVRAAPGDAVGLCFDLDRLDDPMQRQLSVLATTFKADPAGAAGGEVHFVEHSPIGDCAKIISTSPGQSPADIAAAVEAAFQEPGVPGPADCPADENPRDIEQDGNLPSVISILASDLQFCVNDEGLGFSVGPHGVDMESVPVAEMWQMFRHNRTRSGRTNVIGAQTSTLRWTFNADFLDVESSPSVGVDGTIYVGGDSNDLFALNPNGTLRWKFHAAADVDSSPAVGLDGTVYVGSDDDRLYAIDGATGTLEWALSLGGLDVDSSPAVGLDGTVYVGSDSNRLYAISPTGTIQWTFNTGGNVDSSPAIGADGTLYVGSDSNDVFAIRPDGTQRWRFQTGGDVNSTPALSPDGSTIYVGSDNGRLYALNAATGALRWATNTGDDVRSSPAVAANGTIYVGNENRRVFALNPANGAINWTFTTNGSVDSSPAVGGDGTIYVGSDDNRIYALNPTGTLKWVRATGADVNSSPAIGPDGTIYVGSNDDRLYAIGP